jgi:hypothetical protein
MEYRLHTFIVTLLTIEAAYGNVAVLRYFDTFDSSV